MEENIEEEQEKLSKYNSALLQIGRLNRLWDRCHLYRQTGRYKAWKLCLDSCWMELGPDATKEIVGEHKKYIKKIQKAGVNPKNTVDRYELYELLQNFELFLKKLQNKLGLGPAYREESDEAME